MQIRVDMPTMEQLNRLWESMSPVDKYKYIKLNRMDHKRNQVKLIEDLRYDHNIDIGCMDDNTHAEIMQRCCSLYYRNFDSSGQIKGTSTKKYRTIIKPIADQQKNQKHTGKGMNLMQIPNQNIDYIYWDDPNELVDRLRLLISSTQAGHNKK